MCHAEGWREGRPGRRLRAVAAGLDAATRLDGEERGLLNLSRVVVHAVHGPGVEDELDQRPVVDFCDLILPAHAQPRGV